MEAIAKYKYAPISPQKARLVADQIRGIHTKTATSLLSFSVKKASFFVNKVLQSVIANAENNFRMDKEKLFVSKIFVDCGPTRKTFHARARGRGNKILKRSCHITVIVSDTKKNKD